MIWFTCVLSVMVTPLALNFSSRGVEQLLPSLGPGLWHSWPGQLSSCLLLDFLVHHCFLAWWDPKSTQPSKSTCIQAINSTRSKQKIFQKYFTSVLEIMLLHSTCSFCFQGLIIFVLNIKIKSKNKIILMWEAWLLFFLVLDCVWTEDGYCSFAMACGFT